MTENIHLLKMGRGSYYDRDINIVTWSDEYKLFIGNYCSIGRYCTFFLHADHRTDWVTTSSQLMGPVSPEIDRMLKDKGHPASKGDIIIENDVWIGAYSTVMSGVTIGNGAVVAAHSVVTRDVHPYSIVAGNPAKCKKYRFRPREMDLLQEIQWWNWPPDKIRKEAELLWSDNITAFLMKHKINNSRL